MGLAEDIKQSKFRNNRQKAALNILFTSNWLNERTREFLSNYELTNQQFNVLRILRGSNPTPLSTQQIRDRMLDKMSDTSRIVDRLRKKGLVEKKVCEGDKRLVDVNISKKGMAILSDIDKKEEDLFQSLDSLSEKEAELLSSFCDRIRS
jgi:MarR family 2-MHQ and catechol resistance regulon transcriptional repressor